MPAPVAVGMYVLAAVGTVAAGLAFKEFVYEPHIAPRVERWAEEFLAKRKARRMKRAGKQAVAVPSTSGAGAGAGASVGANDTDLDAGVDADGKSTYELENLVADEVRQWRSQVDVHATASSGLRHRKTRSSTVGSALDESNIIIPYDTLTPTHILFDPTDGLSVSSPASTSTMSSRVATPGPGPSPHSTLSHSTFRTPPPPPVMQAPPTPEPSVHGAPSPSATPSRSPARGPTPNQEQHAPEQDPFLFSISSPHHVPSLSLSHPLDLDLESDRDLELLSAPSSRPTSPFSDGDFSVSQEHEHEQFHSFTLSPGPELRVLSASGSEADAEDLERWSTTGSEVSGSESSWASAGAPHSRSSR
ncbi:hypothetical protein MVEN_01464100 [Mycena venus]|uniref:Uncharacterized protein n=1 Tax=Mycena venus TaxID=2733690 RepID=A0A8H6XS73_9AGAR|nr:hypothetical protein MVEN_01464100 [Mycena venus]